MSVLGDYMKFLRGSVFSGLDSDLIKYGKHLRFSFFKELNVKVRD